MPNDQDLSPAEVRELLRTLEEQHRRRELDEGKYRARRAELQALLRGEPAAEKSASAPAPEKQVRYGGKRTARSRQFAIAVGVVAAVLVTAAILGQRKPGSSAPEVSVSQEAATGAPSAAAMPPEAMQAGPSPAEIPRVDLGGVPPDRQKQVVERLNTEMCPCTCGMTLAQCLRDDPTCEHHEAPVRAIVEGAGGRFLTKTATTQPETAAAAPVAGGSGGAERVESLMRDLTEEQKQRVRGRLATEKCPCNCGMTLATCLAEDPSCTHNREPAERIVQSVRLGQ